MPWVIAGLVLLAGVLLFNSFVRLRNRTREAFSGVDVQLKRRHDLVPNLVDVVRAYAAHERNTLEDVVRARGAAEAASGVAAREETEGALRRSLDRLLVLVERYPELKADRRFLDLQEDLVDVEDHLQYARRYYNATVRDYNTRIEQFPARLLAPLCGFRRAAFFQIEDASQRAAPAIDAEDE